MELKEIAAVSGKGGLFRILKPTRNGVILESLDDLKTKIVAGQTSKVSILEEISIYTLSGEGTVALGDVLKKTHEVFPKGLEVNSKSEGADLQEFMAKVLPDFDSDRVYNSDIKKLVSWYGILLKHAPELLKPAETEPSAPAPADEKPAKKAKVKAEAQAEEEAKEKPAAKKTAKPKAAKQ